VDNPPNFVKRKARPASVGDATAGLTARSERRCDRATPPRRSAKPYERRRLQGRATRCAPELHAILDDEKVIEAMKTVD